METQNISYKYILIAAHSKCKILNVIFLLEWQQDLAKFNYLKEAAVSPAFRDQEVAVSQITLSKHVNTFFGKQQKLKEMKIPAPLPKKRRKSTKQMAHVRSPPEELHQAS